MAFGVRRESDGTSARILRRTARQLQAHPFGLLPIEPAHLGVPEGQPSSSLVHACAAPVLSIYHAHRSRSMLPERNLDYPLVALERLC